MRGFHNKITSSITKERRVSAKHVLPRFHHITIERVLDFSLEDACGVFREVGALLREQDVADLCSQKVVNAEVLVTG